MNVVVTGSRGLPPLPGQRQRRPLPQTVVDHIHYAIDNLAPGSIVRQGKADGADQIARARALSRGLTVEDFPPQYDKYPPRYAPLKRNEEMADTDAEVCFAFCVADSRGTMHCVKEFLKRGKGVVVHHFDAEGNFTGFSSPADYE